MVPVSALYSYYEPSYRGLKLQKRFARSLLDPIKLMILQHRIGVES
jgi:hypothetical protein